MCNAVFFSDLDGTLIFSAGKRLPGDIVCEYKDGAEISCITARQAELLPGITVIPVTTRSVEQYRRISFPEGFAPEYALADNGGTLLINGVPDPEWEELTRSFTQECRAELSRCREAMERDPHRSFEIRMVDGLFLFTKSQRPEISLESLQKAAGERVRCFHTGAKLYALPEKLCKGALAKRLADRTAPGREIVCAGDSPMDVPLLNIADTALFPDDMPEDMITARRKLAAPRDRFPEFVTEYLFKQQKGYTK